MSLHKSCFARLGLAIAVLACCSLAATAQTWTLLHSFTGPDGYAPQAGVTMDAAGNFYGTTSEGGAHNQGTVFKLTRRGSSWTLTTLYSFSGPDGSTPSARVIFGPDGTLYGTTYYGGAGYGVVYRLQPPAGFCRSVQCSWTETVLYTFQDRSDGGYPIYGDLAFDQQGNIYGTAPGGGINSANCDSFGCGVVYKLTRSGASWTYSVLYSFTGNNDGGVPVGGVILDSSGNLYGPAAGGGAYQNGVVYKLTSSGSGWTESVLYDFPSLTDGTNPEGGLIFDRFGNLYGTTERNGEDSGGTVYELTPANGGWNFAVLAAVPAYTGSVAKLAMDSSGNLYGTVALGSFEVFKLTHSGGTWLLTQFGGGGSVGSVVVDSNGTIYGADTYGQHNEGSVFAITQ